MHRRIRTDLVDELYQCWSMNILPEAHEALEILDIAATAYSDMGAEHLPAAT